jgi:hypothetical protein
LYYKVFMSDLDSASSQLRVIRSLMERATIYRAMSAPTSFVGGLLSIGGFGAAYYAKHHRHVPLSSNEFLVVWLVILALTGLTNVVFLARDAARRGDPFISSGMKCAFFSLAPAFFAAGLLTLMIHRPIHLALVWITFYGIGLLATQHFAPRSLVILGLAFFVTGCGLVASWKHLFLPNPHLEPSALVVSGLMAATFGGYHLAYAAVVWALGEEKSAPLSSSTEIENV